MTTTARLLLASAITLFSVAVDQATKLWAQAALPHDAMHSYLGDFLRVGFTKNYGAFLGLGNQLPESWRYWIFTIMVGVFLVALLIYMVSAKALTYPALTGLSLFFSGGLSNFYDRLVHQGGVVDFLNLGFGGLRTGIFNVADVAIMLGAFVMIWQAWRQAPEKTSAPG